MVLFYSIPVMAVTMGFVLRVDSYPPAVAIPPLQQAIPPGPPVIEAQKVVEPGLSAASSRTGSNQQHYRPASMPEQTALTYSRQGSMNAHTTDPAATRGQLLNIYA